MPTYLITAPDGRKFKITGEGTKEEALAQLQSRYSEPDGQQPAAPEQPPEQALERAKLQKQLDQQLVASEEAGKTLGREELISSFARPILRGAVDLADGVLTLPRLAASIPVAGYNLVTDSNAQLPISQSVADVRTGSRELLAPRNAEERYATAITRGVGGVLGGLGLGSVLGGATGAVSTTANVGRTLLANPGLQTAGAITGATSAELAKDAGAGPIGQTIAGLAGSIAPSLAVSGAAATTRGAFRGGEQGRRTVERNVETFGRAGTTPSVGQATQRRTNQAAETLLGRLPGGAGPIARKAQTEGEELAARIEQNAAQLAGRTSPETTGGMISRQIENQFLPTFRAQQRALYGRLDQLVPDATPATVTNTQRALTELTRATPGAAATTARLVNPRIRQMAEDLALDAQGGSVPYSALRELRTRIGEQLDNGLVGDVPQSQWRTLYGALSDDLRAAADAAGPQARRAFDRANNYTRAGHARIEVLDDVLNKAGGREAVFNAAVSGAKDGATKLRAVMRSLDPAGQRTLSATMLRRLGRSVNSQQDETGERFSTQTFLTNWNKLSPEARGTLFGNLPPQYTRDIEALARVASNIREGSKVFSNPSGTGQAAIQGGTVGSFALSVLTGRLDVAAAIAAGAGSANMAARLMTNPRFVRWLAVSTRVPQSALTSQINGLAQMARDSNDQELFEAAALLKEGTTQ